MTRPASRSRFASAVWTSVLLLSITTGWAQPAAGPSAALELAAVQLDGPADRSGPGAARSGFTSAINFVEHQPEPSITAPVVPAQAPALEPVAEKARSRPSGAKEKAQAAAKAQAKAQTEATKTATRAPATAPTYAGENRFWMPALGISKRVLPFACSRTTSPDNYIYRWGCAGENNVYILGHAYSVMEPLHDAYVGGTLRKGMVALYANDNGAVRKYKVTEWRVVDPTDSAWAIADQARPSMTLQTCVGKHSQWRLLVRLVAVD